MISSLELQKPTHSFITIIVLRSDKKVCGGLDYLMDHFRFRQIFMQEHVIFANNIIQLGLSSHS